ncbi:MAG: hypothetical protein ACI9S8_002714, partial [Chlamydiales bacterium]
MIKTVHQQFSKIPDPRDLKRESAIPLKDHLMSGLA